jgi:hypothetical protein
MNRSACLVIVVLGSLALTAGGSASRTTRDFACESRQLAFALPEPSAPMQTWAVGFDVYNIGGACRLALPISLTLAHRAGPPLQAAPRSSRLTLVARKFSPHARAGVTWTYTNYCGRHNSSERPITYSVRVRGIELRGLGGTPPCQSRKRPVQVRVLFACPSATGSAIAAILPRPLPLCNG